MTDVYVAKFADVIPDEDDGNSKFGMALPVILVCVNWNVSSLINTQERVEEYYEETYGKMWAEGERVKWASSRKQDGDTQLYEFTFGKNIQGALYVTKAELV